MSGIEEELIGESLDYEEYDIDEEQEQALLADEQDTEEVIIHEVLPTEDQEIVEPQGQESEEYLEYQSQDVETHNHSDAILEEDHVGAIEDHVGAIEEDHVGAIEQDHNLLLEEEEEEEDDSDETSGRDRFKSERTKLSLIPSPKKQRQIPDNLDDVIKTLDPPNYGAQSSRQRKMGKFRGGGRGGLGTPNSVNNARQFAPQNVFHMGQNFQNQVRFINTNQGMPNMIIQRPVLPLVNRPPLMPIGIMPQNLTQRLRPIWPPQQPISQPLYYDFTKNVGQNFGNQSTVVRTNFQGNTQSNIGQLNGANRKKLPVQMRIARPPPSKSNNPNLKTVPTVDLNAANNKDSDAKETPFPAAQTEDLEYKRKLEEQKQKRDAILKQKELRRKQMAAKNPMEPEASVSSLSETQSVSGPVTKKLKTTGQFSHGKQNQVRPPLRAPNVIPTRMNQSRGQPPLINRAQHAPNHFRQPPPSVLPPSPYTNASPPMRPPPPSTNPLVPSTLTRGGTPPPRLPPSHVVRSIAPPRPARPQQSFARSIAPPRMTTAMPPPTNISRPLPNLNHPPPNMNAPPLNVDYMRPPPSVRHNSPRFPASAHNFHSPPRGPPPPQHNQQTYHTEPFLPTPNSYEVDRFMPPYPSTYSQSAEEMRASDSEYYGYESERQGYDYQDYSKPPAYPDKPNAFGFEGEGEIYDEYAPPLPQNSDLRKKLTRRPAAISSSIPRQYTVLSPTPTSSSYPTRSPQKIVSSQKVQKRFKKIIRRNKNGEIISIKKLLLDDQGNIIGPESIEYPNKDFLPANASKPSQSNQRNEAYKTIPVVRPKTIAPVTRTIRAQSHQSSGGRMENIPGPNTGLRMMRPRPAGGQYVSTSSNPNLRRINTMSIDKSSSLGQFENRRKDSPAGGGAPTRPMRRVIGPPLDMEPRSLSSVKLMYLPASVDIQSLFMQLSDLPTTVFFDENLQEYRLEFSSSHAARQFCQFVKQQQLGRAVASLVA